MNLQRLRILVADVAAMDAGIRAILNGDDLSFARASAEVERLLSASNFDLAVVCERFEGHGFEFLRSIAARRAERGIPVVCIRASSTLEPAVTPDGYRDTVLGLGAKAVADVRSGSPVELDRIRRMFYACIDKRTLMLKSNAYRRILQLAAETLESRERLAVLLGVTEHELMRWLSGAELPPFAAYCSALDIVAAGPYADPQVRNGQHQAGFSR